jgi:ATP-dependent Lon protease
VILPERNRKDLVDVAEDVQKEMEFVFVSTVDQIPSLALTEELKPLPIITGEGTLEQPKAEA